MDFGEVNFHDAYILGINITTTNDHFEQIKIFLESINFTADLNTTKVILEFMDCYKASLQLQMWIKGKDTIRAIKFIDSESSADLKRIAEMKEKGLLKKDDIFSHCEITLNTSGSKIDIVAKEIRLLTNQERFLKRPTISN